MQTRHPKLECLLLYLFGKKSAQDLSTLFETIDWKSYTSRAARDQILKLNHYYVHGLHVLDLRWNQQRFLLPEH